MKLKSLEAKNFRGIKEAKIHFSDDASRPLTIIEAGHGGGKSTMVLALRWALFGDLAAAGVSANSHEFFLKAPATWDVEKQGTDIPVEVGVWLSAQTDGVEIDYRVIRKQAVRVSESDRIGQDQEEVIEVYKESGGLELLENPDDFIRTRFLTPSLMDVFLNSDFESYFYTPAVPVGIVEKEIGLPKQRGDATSELILEDLSRLLNSHWQMILQQAAEDQDFSGQAIRDLFIMADLGIGARSASGEIMTTSSLTAATRAALAISLVLALSEYAGLEMPLVIDFPFGRASSALKRRLLGSLVAGQRQLVFLMNPEDIKSFGEQLGRNAGRHFQLRFGKDGIVSNEI